MVDNFYLWCDYILGINDINMKKIREKPEWYIKKIKEDYDEKIIADIKTEMRKKNIWYITIEDPKYPESLKNIYDPPYILYYIGEIALLKEESILAVVGARAVTDYGRNVATNLVSNLTRKGMVIASGLAKGVDSCAHVNCINSGGKTIAVLGTAIDKVYPVKNVGLLNQIVKSGGLVISENRIGSISKPYKFARRNRIISGISKGVLVIEADIKSGALITADCALQQNREVYAVPGNIYSKMSRGCNKILSEGAKLVTKYEDILEDFTLDLEGKIMINQNNKNKFQKNSGKSSLTCVNIGFDDRNIKNLLEEEKLILNLLSTKGAMDIDQLSVNTGFSIEDINYYLNKLCLLDMIVEQGLNTYATNIL